ncbi:glycosyltransferase family 4 protein [Alkalinema sp. FACHB-956]|uniref:glycosyltransferase family 4 protein n=1 Tax=Alkalinema sp. FACHB-956 TaxID=2692768 RepID=UPI0016877F9F|nr:glycosyltransferase family 4 protein [Alkalinema sp. FACHB-956]MBD2329617.1 glycosyltransferase family 4 protein [Alkalinema sp. FACHB-956]
MKACIVTHKVAKGDGQGRVNYEVAREVLHRGHRLTLLASSIAPELQDHPNLNWIKISVASLPTELFKNLAFMHHSHQWLKQNAHHYDVTKINGTITSYPADVNAVHFVHSAWLQSSVHPAQIHRNLYGSYQWLYSKFNALLEHPILSQARTVVAVSQKVGQELTEIGISPSQIQVIFNGVDLDEFHPGQSDRSQWQLPNSVPLALFAGDIRSNRKNLDTILKALQQVPELHLAVVGNPEQSPFPQMAINLGVSNRTYFLGYRRDLPAIMRAVDFFIFPSRYEACTLVVLEAMASGLPVITAKTTGGSEIIHPDCGIVLPDSEDSVAIAEAAHKLMTQSNLRHQMGQTARKIAEQYSWSTMAKHYVDLFEFIHQQKLQRE